MAASVPDSVPNPSGEQRQTQNARGLATGLFYADSDIGIANRLAGKIRDHRCNLSLFDFHNGGKFKLQEVENFIQSKRLVLWLATTTSLNDKAILEAARHIAQYASIVRRDLNIHFVVLQPHEHLNARLPLSLDAYTSLREDTMFAKRIQTTVGSIFKSLRDKGIQTPQESTATTAAVAGEGGDYYRNVPANSDTMEESIVYDGQGNIDLTACPEKQGGAVGNSAEQDACTRNTISPQEPREHTSIHTFHIHVTGDKNSIQLGTDSVMTLVRESQERLPPVRPRPDDNNDGTPV